jgi:hypothetical protein
MSLRTALRWTLPPLALIALAGWLRSGSTPAPGAPAPAEKKIIFFSSPPAAGFTPGQGPATLPPAAGPDRSAAVAKFVAQKNAESARDQEAFVRAGWQMVQAPPPDPKLIALDPSLLPAREAELRQQISSTSASPAQAANLARIAREAGEEQTRIAAVEALGRIGGDEAQDQLLGLLRALPDGTPARREVAPLLRPRDLSDSRAAALAQLLDSRDLDPVERKQIAFTLSLVGLRDRSALPGSVLERLSPEARALLESTASLAKLSP